MRQCVGVATLSLTRKFRFKDKASPLETLNIHTEGRYVIGAELRSSCTILASYLPCCFFSALFGPAVKMRMLPLPHKHTWGVIYFTIHRRVALARPNCRGSNDCVRAKSNIDSRPRVNEVFLAFLLGLTITIVGETLDWRRSASRCR